MLLIFIALIKAYQLLYNLNKCIDFNFNEL